MDEAVLLGRGIVSGGLGDAGVGRGRVRVCAMGAYEWLGIKW